MSVWACFIHHLQCWIKDSLLVPQFLSPKQSIYHQSSFTTFPFLPSYLVFVHYFLYCVYPVLCVVLHPHLAAIVLALLLLRTVSRCSACLAFDYSVFVSSFLLFLFLFDSPTEFQVSCFVNFWLKVLLFQTSLEFCTYLIHTLIDVAVMHAPRLHRMTSGRVLLWPWAQDWQVQKWMQ